MTEYPPPPPGDAGQPQDGQPQYGQPQYGQPQYGQPQYGPPQPPYDPSAYQQSGYTPTEQLPPYGQYGQYGAAPGPNVPRSNRKAIIATAAVVILAAGGVTAGLLLSGGDDKKKSVGGGGGGAQAVFDGLISAFNSKNADGVRAGLCADATGVAGRLRDQTSAALSSTSSITVVREPVESGSTAFGAVIVKASGGSSPEIPFVIRMSKESSGWCVTAMDSAGSIGGGGAASGGGSAAASSGGAGGPSYGGPSYGGSNLPSYGGSSGGSYPSVSSPPPSPYPS